MGELTREQYPSCSCPLALAGHKCLDRKRGAQRTVALLLGPPPTTTTTTTTTSAGSSTCTHSTSRTRTSSEMDSKTSSKHGVKPARLTSPVRCPRCLSLKRGKLGRAGRQQAPRQNQDLGQRSAERCAGSRADAVQVGVYRETGQPSPAPAQRPPGIGGQGLRTEPT